jgi:hypothetical protein
VKGALNTIIIANSIFASVVLIWTQLRFWDVSKPYRKQIKYYFAVALTYSAYYLCLFVILMTVLTLLSTKAIDLIGYAGLKDLKDFLIRSPEFVPPLLSAALLYKARNVRFFSWLDTFIVDRLLSAHNMEEDYNELKRLLEDNDFSPSPEEISKNLDMIEEFAVFVSDPPKELPDLHSGDPVTLWRKVSTLIRCCKVWLKDDDNSDLKTRLGELYDEHHRRTGATLQMLRLKMATESLQNFGQQIKPEEIPPQIPNQDNRPPLIVTSDQLGETTKLFSEYLIKDYTKLIGSVSDIAAQLVIYSGSAAGCRLSQLKKAGFKQLGNYRELTFHKIILILMSVFLGAFVLFYVFFYFNREPGPEKLSNLALTTKIATVYAFSALCGALIGSSRRIMKAGETPWGWYLMAGILGWLVWLTITVLIDFSPDLAPGENTFADEVQKFISSEGLRRALPWSILPLAFAIGVATICRHNPIYSGACIKKARIADGAMLGLVLMSGLWISFMVRHGMQEAPAAENLNNEGGMNLIIIFPASIAVFVFAFTVGAIVINMARKVALSGLAAESADTDKLAS